MLPGIRRIGVRHIVGSLLHDDLIQTAFWPYNMEQRGKLEQNTLIRAHTADITEEITKRDNVLSI